MRIDAYNKIAQVYGTQASSKVNKKANVGGSDQVVISQFGKDYQTARAAISSVPDIREDKVSQLKKQIDANDYNVDNEDFADMLIKRYFGDMD